MIRLLEKHYRDHDIAFPILLEHSHRVADKALAIGKRLSSHRPVNLKFIEEAALLHDIGIFLTDAPDIGCFGEKHYLEHGYLGREILEQEGLPEHALVCERHIGVGLSRHDIIEQSLPLPQREMMPVSIEEKIIAYSDLFFSKSPADRDRERSFAQIRQKMSRYGSATTDRLDALHEEFSL